MSPILLVFLILLVVGVATFALAEWLALRLIRSTDEFSRLYDDLTDG